MATDEQKAFLVFLRSPYFNRQPRLLELARDVLQQSPESAPDPEALHASLFGAETPLAKQALYDAFSQLTKLLDRFLALQVFEADRAVQQRCLLEALARKKEEKAYQRQWDKASSALESHPYRDLTYYERQYELQRHASNFEAALQRRTQDLRLYDTVRYLDQYYWTARLKYSCELLNRSNILNQPAPQELIAPLENGLTTLPAIYLACPAIHAYVLIFRALQAPEMEAHYLTWIAWLETNSHQFSPREAADMYNYAQNYCVRRINQGDSGYLGRLFHLFDQLLAKDLVLEQGYMDHRKLKNMVTVGIRLRAFEWVDTFLHNYREKLLPAYRQDAYLFNLASLRFAQAEHSDSLALLQQIEFSDVFYDLSARSLMIKIYYETDEDAALEFLLDTFRMYLQRNRSISGLQRRVHLNLLRFTRKLHRLRMRKGTLAPPVFQERLTRLAADIRAADEVANSSWLLEQVATLQA